MTVYTIVKFIHVAAAVSYFIAVGTLVFATAALRRVQRIEQVRTLSEVVRWTTPLFLASIATLLVAGIFLTFDAWSWQTGWIDVAFVSLIVLVPVAARLVGSRNGKISALTLEPAEGKVTPEMLKLTQDPALFATPRVTLVLLFGIEFLMTNKPSLLVALLVMVIAVALGLAWGLFLPRMRQPPSRVPA